MCVCVFRFLPLCILGICPSLDTSTVFRSLIWLQKWMSSITVSFYKIKMANIQPRVEAYPRSRGCTPAESKNANVTSNWREIPDLEQFTSLCEMWNFCLVLQVTDNCRRAQWILVGYLAVRADRFDPVLHAVLVRKQNGCFCQDKCSRPPQEAELELFSALIYIHIKLLFEVGNYFSGLLLMV